MSSGGASSKDDAASSVRVDILGGDAIAVEVLGALGMVNFSRVILEPCFAQRLRVLAQRDVVRSFTAVVVGNTVST